jgi:hypothetical protein
MSPDHLGVSLKMENQGEPEICKKNKLSLQCLEFHLENGKNHEFV